MSKMSKYPEVVHNHFQYCHAVDDHNAKWHSPISIELVWATKQWPNRVFCFLLLITEVNCFLAESYFTGQNSDSMLDFQKHLLFELIENAYMREEDRVEHHRLARIREGIGHGLVSLPPWKKFHADISLLLCPNTHRKNAAIATMKYNPIVYALLGCPCAAIAWQVTCMIAKRILKVAS